MTYDAFGRLLGQDRGHEGHQGEGEDGELHFLLVPCWSGFRI